MPGAIPNLMVVMSAALQRAMNTLRDTIGGADYIIN